MPGTESVPSKVNLQSLLGIQVRNIINNLTTSNVADSIVELNGYKQKYGEEISLYILVCLVEAVDFNEPKPLSKDAARLQLLSHELTKLSQFSNFASFVLRAFPEDMEVQLISHICEVLQLPIVQEIAFGLAFAQSTNLLVQQKGTQFLKKKLNEISTDSIKQENVPEHLLHGLLFVMKTQEDFQKQLSNILEVFSIKNTQLNEKTPLSLCSILVGSQGSNSQWNIKAEREQGASINHRLSEKLMGTVCPAALMEDIGYSCCSTVNQFNKFISKFLPLHEQNLAKMIVLVSRKDKKLGPSIAMQEYTSVELYGNSDRETTKPTAWNIPVFIQVLQDLNLSMNWSLVVRGLDFPGFCLNDFESFVTFQTIFSTLSKVPFPTKEILGPWKEKDGQLSLLRLIVVTPNNGLSFHGLREFSLYENGRGGKSLPFNTSIPPCWLCIDLVERLFLLSEYHRYEIVRALFEPPMKQSPEILALVIAQVHSLAQNALHRELSSQLMVLFFRSQSAVLHQVWASNRRMIMQGMLDLYKVDEKNLSGILEIAQNLKRLKEVLLEVPSYRFVVELATLASRREFLFLEKWLPDFILRFGEPFVRVCVQFLTEKCQQDPQQKGPLANTLKSFASCLTQHAKVISPDLQEEIAQFRGPASLEQRVCATFSQLYQTQSVDQAVSLLNKLKLTPNPDDRELYDSMIAILLDDSLYYNQQSSQLAFTAELFGSLIQYRIVDGPNLTKALVTLQNTLCKPPNSLVFQVFGLGVLQKIRNSLNAHPEFCKNLKMIPNLLKYAPGLSQYLGPSPEHLLEHSAAQSIPVPDQEMQDLVSFIFNNVAAQNLLAKAEELKKHLTEEFYPWLARYLVNKRICIEENFHGVYIEFLDILQLNGFDKLCLQATFQSCAILLKSDIINNTANERNMLKSVGNWLGLITLAKNIPILSKHLDLKNLLIDAYQKGRLIAVVSFVAKILLVGATSRIFRPPNSYVMLLIRLLAEVYQLPNLKLNIKFEIELLCTGLGLDVVDVTPTSFLHRMDQCPPPNPDLTISEAVKPGTLHVVIDPSLTILSENPQLVAAVRLSIEKAVAEIKEPVLARFVGIACSTTIHLIKKDFANEPNKKMVHNATHLMVKNLVGNLASVTCKDSLRTGIEKYLKTFLTNPPVASPATIATIIEKICNDNLDNACQFIERHAMEQAVANIETQMASILTARPVGLPFVRFLPTYLFADANGLQQHHWKVYEDFSRVAPTSFSPTHIPVPPFPAQITNPTYPQHTTRDTTNRTVQEIHERFKLLLQQFETKAIHTPTKDLVFQCLSHMGSLIEQSPAPEETRLRIAENLFSRLYAVAVHNETLLDIYSFFLEQIALKTPIIVTKITDAYTLSPQERKFNKNVTVKLIQFRLLSLPEFDAHLAQLLGNGNQQALEFALHVMGRCIQELQCVSQKQLPRSIETIERLKSGPQHGGQRQNASYPIPQTVKEARDLNDFLFDNGKIREIAIQVFEKWCRLVSSADLSAEVELSRDFLKDQSLNMLLSESMPSFFAFCTQCAVQLYLSGSGSATLDAFAQLISLLFEESLVAGRLKQAVNLVNTALNAVAVTLESCYALNMREFNQQPYFHLFSHWLYVLVPFSEEYNSMVHWQLLVLFSNLFMSLTPSKLIGFCFSWVELISHQQFMPQLLNHSSKKGLVKFQELLVELFQFLEPFLRSSELSKTVQLLYNGTLRVLLVLVHDFPEFLCDYHFAFCDVIPPSCIQMRNLILSAFPRTMRLPDPATPDLKVDCMDDIHKPPNILSSYSSTLQRNKLVQDVDSYLEKRAPASFLTEKLRSHLLLPPQEAYANDVAKYNVPLINSLVLYVGIYAINNSKSTPAALDIFLSLCRDLDDEGRYWMLNAIANQLRYPNNQTYYFSGVILRLFADTNLEEFVKEQITRVLLERLIVRRPHPWGLLITFIELLQNRQYSFWNHRFITNAVEIQRLFHGVAKQSQFPTDEN